jgi:hypothetical protein
MIRAQKKPPLSESQNASKLRKKHGLQIYPTGNWQMPIVGKNASEPGHLYSCLSSETGLWIPFGLRRLPPNVGRVTNHLSSFRATSSSAGFDMLILFLD